MRLDFQTHEALVLIAADDKKGLWSHQSFTKALTKQVRNGGQLRTEASAHTLLLVALTTALRAISRKNVEKLLQSTPRDVFKPRVVVGCADPSFGDAIRAFMEQNASGKALRAGRNFKELAAKELLRFDLTFEQPEDSDTCLLVLGGWAKNNLIENRLLIPGLLPSAVSAVVNQ